MIEDAMFLALGFFAAMLIALACVPILWARAMRLTRRRLELLVPLSVKEIDAARDGLRADAAVSQRRLEQGLERASRASADLSAELGHRTVSLVTAERAIDDLRTERAGLITEVANLGRQNRDEEAQRVAMEKALHDSEAHIASASVDAREQIALYEALFLTAEERRGSIAALETQRAGLLAQLEDRDSDIAHMTSTLRTLKSSVAELMRERDTARNEVLILATQRQSLETRLRDEIERGEEGDRRATAKAEALAATEQRAMDQDMRPKRTVEALAELKHRFDALQTQIAEAALQDSDDLFQVDEHLALRKAIVVIGEEALRLLGPQNDRRDEQPVPDSPIEAVMTRGGEPR